MNCFLHCFKKGSIGATVLVVHTVYSCVTRLVLDFTGLEFRCKFVHLSSYIFTSNWIFDKRNMM